MQQQWGKTITVLSSQKTQGPSHISYLVKTDRENERDIEIDRERVRSEKIIRGPAGGVRLDLSGGRVKLEELLLHVVANLQNGRGIPTSVAVVGGTEYRHHILFLKHGQLLSSGNLFCMYKK